MISDESYSLSVNWVVAGKYILAFETVFIFLIKLLYIWWPTQWRNVLKIFFRDFFHKITLWDVLSVLSWWCSMRWICRIDDNIRRILYAEWQFYFYDNQVISFLIALYASGMFHHEHYSCFHQGIKLL